jgi:hypothetical protein
MEKMIKVFRSSGIITDHYDDQRVHIMSPNSDQSDKSNLRAEEALEGLLKEFERLRRNTIPEAKAKDLSSVLRFIQTQIMGTRESLETFIQQIETQRGTTIPEDEADVLIRKAKLVISQLCGG